MNRPPRIRRCTFEQLEPRLNFASDVRIELSQRFLSENQPSATEIGALSLSPPSSNAVFELIGMSTRDNFSVLNDRLIARHPFDFERQAVYSVRVRATGVEVETTEQSFDVTIGNVNDAPLAQMDVVKTSDSNDSAFSVLDNDTDPELNRLTAELVDGPENGTLTLRSNGTFDYVPRIDFRGTDHFVYRAVDEFGLKSNLADVYLRVGDLELRDFNTTPSTFSMEIVASAVNGTVFVRREPAGNLGLWVAEHNRIEFSKVFEVASQIISLDGYVYAFSGTDLWKSDGTVAGTTKTSLEFPNGIRPSLTGSLVAYDGALYFVGNGDDGTFLMRSHGTAESTTSVARLKAEVGISFFSNNFTLAQGVFYFVLFGTGPIEIWCSDGTTVGTQIINAVDVPIGDFRPDRLFGTEDRLFVTTWSKTGQRELWTTDPTGRQLLKLMNLEGYQLDFQFYSTGGKQYFAYAPNSGFELWSTDGTAAGTRRVGDFTISTTESGELPSIVAVDNWIYVIRGELGIGPSIWRADIGTDEFETFLTLPHNAIRTRIFILGNRLLLMTYFIDSSSELSAIDPVTHEKVALGKFGEWAHPRRLEASDGNVYFETQSPNGTHVWKSDGTSYGTQTVGTIGLRTDSSRTEGWIKLGETLFSKTSFLSTDGPLSNVQGTQVFDRYSSSDRMRFGKQRIYYSAANLNFTLLAWDAISRIGPNAIADWHNRYLEDVFSLADIDILVVINYETKRMEIWRTDGRSDGTSLVKVFPLEPYGGMRGVVFKNHLYFVATDSDHGRELWRTDGTAENTDVFVDIFAGPNDGISPMRFAAIGDEMFFSANDGTHGREPWVTDGTKQGTKMMADLSPGADGSLVDRFVSVGAEVAFTGATTWIGGSLFVANAKRDGTQLVVGPCGMDARVSLNEEPASVGDNLYFTMDDCAHGKELWQFNGTTREARLVKDISNLPQGIGPVSLFASTEDGVFFTATTEETGNELWFTDGTSESTGLVADINPGAGSSNPNYLQVFGDSLYFTADDSLVGFEPWRLPLSSKNWSNPAIALDVTNDGAVSPIDYLTIIDELNKPNPKSKLGFRVNTVPPFLDTNGDGYLSPIDALLIGNELNRDADGEAPLRSSMLSFQGNSALDWTPTHELSPSNNEPPQSSDTSSNQGTAASTSNETLQPQTTSFADGHTILGNFVTERIWRPRKKF